MCSSNSWPFLKYTFLKSDPCMHWGTTDSGKNSNVWQTCTGWTYKGERKKTTHQHVASTLFIPCIHWNCLLVKCSFENKQTVRQTICMWYTDDIAVHRGRQENKPVQTDSSTDNWITDDWQSRLLQYVVLWIPSDCL